MRRPVQVQMMKTLMAACDVMGRVQVFLMVAGRI